MSTILIRQTQLFEHRPELRADYIISHRHDKGPTRGVKEQGANDVATITRLFSKERGAGK